jgi:ribonuclease-3
LADALEAVIGALFMDAGYATAEAFVLRLFADVDISPGVAVSEKDPKTALQEWLQGRRMRLPVYRVVGTVGAAHQQTFDVECEVTEWHLSERGIGPSRRAGEQLAAAAMLAQLKARFP